MLILRLTLLTGSAWGYSDNWRKIDMCILVEREDSDLGAAESDAAWLK